MQLNFSFFLHMEPLYLALTIIHWTFSRFSLVRLQCMRFSSWSAYEQMSNFYTLHYSGSLFCARFHSLRAAAYHRVLSFVAYITVLGVRAFCTYYKFFLFFHFSPSSSFDCIKKELNFEIHHIECVVFYYQIHRRCQKCCFYFEWKENYYIII